MSKKNVKQKCSLRNLSKYELTNDLTNNFLTPLHNKRKPKPKVYLGDEETNPSHITITKISNNNRDDEMPSHSITVPSDEERYQNMVNEGLIRNELFNLGIPSHKLAKIRRRKALNPENVDPFVYGIDYSQYINDDDTNQLINMLKEDDNYNMFKAFENDTPIDNNLNTEELLSLLKTGSENEPILFITKGGKLRKKKRSSRKTKKKKSKKGKKSRKN